MIDKLFEYYDSKLSLERYTKSKWYIDVCLFLISFIVVGSICFATYCSVYRNLWGLVLSILTTGLSISAAYFLVMYFIVQELKKHAKLKGFCISTFYFSVEKYNKWQLHKLQRKMKSEGIANNEQVEMLLNRIDQLAKAERESVIATASIATVVIVPVWVSYIDKTMDFAKDDFRLLSLMFIMLFILSITVCLLVKSVFSFSNGVLTNYRRVMRFRSLLSKVYFTK